MEPVETSWSKSRKFRFVKASLTLLDLSAPVKQIDPKATLNEAWSVISVTWIWPQYNCYVFFTEGKKMVWNGLKKIYIIVHVFSGQQWGLT